jgi:flagellar biosynthetic protein FliR
VDIAGHVMSGATGMSAANTFNPEIGQTSELSQFYMLVTTLLFFALDAHHGLIAAFVKSYEWVPAGTISVSGIMASALSFTSRVFIIALKISAPVVVIMLVTNILLGFIAKTAPQMPIFFVGQPLYIFLGFLTMLLSLPAFFYLMSGYFKAIPEEMGRVMMLMKG